MKPAIILFTILSLFLMGSCSQDPDLESENREIDKITELTHNGVRAYKDMVAASMYTVLNYPSLSGSEEPDRSATPQVCISVDPDPTFVLNIPEEGVDLVVDLTGECSSLSTFKGIIDMNVKGEMSTLVGSELILRPRKGATSGAITFTGRGGVKLTYIDSTEVKAAIAEAEANDEVFFAPVENIDFAETLFYRTEILGELGFEDDFPAGEVNLRVADIKGGITSLSNVYNNDSENFSSFLDDHAAVSFETMDILIRDLAPFSMQLVDRSKPLTFSLACGCPINGGIEVPDQFFIDYSQNASCDSIRSSGDLVLPCD